MTKPAATSEEEFDFAPFTGSWRGASTLWLYPEGEGDTQPSQAVASTVARDRFLRFDYEWTVDEAVEEGSLLVERDPKRPGFRGAWIDSWHQNREMMLLTGESSDDIDFRGTYQATGYPVWGWRIRLERTQEGLRLLMWNISPEGDERRAVEGRYTRSGGSSP